jgi:hypothetical protein
MAANNICLNAYSRDFSCFPAGGGRPTCGLL